MFSRYLNFKLFFMRFTILEGQTPLIFYCGLLLKGSEGLMPVELSEVIVFMYLFIHWIITRLL
jgi:hypothetical protein